MHRHLGEVETDRLVLHDQLAAGRALLHIFDRLLQRCASERPLARPQPRLRVALLTYGNDGHQAENGWVRLDVPFTADLDLVSQHLFALTTNGGTELVGRVIQRATDELAWSPEDEVFRADLTCGPVAG